MKRQFLLLMLLTSVFAVNAQVFIENFATATVNSKLEGYNGWYVSAKAADALGVSPVIGEDPLFFTGYPGSNIGHVCVLDSAVGETSATQRISTKKIVFAAGDTFMVAPGVKLYAAFIVNVEPKSYRSYRDFFNYEGSQTSSMTRGRVFAKNNAAGNEVIFAVTKNSSSSADYKESTTLGLTLGTGINHLIVLKYEGVDGDSNDKISLFVNPDPTKAEALQANKLEATDVQTDYSATAKLGINLRQRGIGARVGGIRVGRSWETVVMGQTSGVDLVNGNFHNIYAAGNIIVTGVKGHLKVYSLSGVELISSNTEGRYSSKLNAGMYIVQFKDREGTVSSSKILIQ
jgi:hypothetical protein